MKSRRAQLSIAVVCIFLGLMLAYQFQNANNISNLYAKQQVDDLQQQLKDAQKQKEELEKSINDLDNKIAEYEKGAANSNSYANEMKVTLDQVRMFAGQTDVHGPGVKITLSPKVPELKNEPTASIHDFNLLRLVNELNACGAEAIAINGQRIVNTSTIRDIVDGVLRINGISQPMDQPFEVLAIGDPSTLEGGLKTALVDELSMYGIDIKIEQAADVVINKYNKVIDFKYAKPVKEGE